jgi:hypothetical protein
MDLGCRRLRVRWKNIVIGSVLGGLLGFGGQFAVDFFCWVPDVHAQSISGGQLPIESQTLYQYTSWATKENGLARNEFRGPEIVWNAALLFWLKERGELACRAALIVAFLVASAALALDQKGKATAVRSSSKQTNIAANPVVEPDEEKEYEPVEKPAQLEMTEQAEVLKTAPKKARTGA